MKVKFKEELKRELNGERDELKWQLTEAQNGEAAGGAEAIPEEKSE